MNKQGLNPKLATLLVIGAIVLIIYFSFAQTGSLISIMDNGKVLPLETGVFQFAGVQGNYETIKLGCVTGGEFKSVSGTLSVCNSLAEGNKLIITSSLSSNNGCTQGTSGSSCVKSNYILAKIILPAGSYKASYKYDLVENQIDNDGTNIAFTIGDFSTGQKQQTPFIASASESKSGIYEFTLKEPKELIFRIDTGIRSTGGSSSGELVLEKTSSQQTQTSIDPVTGEPVTQPVLTKAKTFFQNILDFILKLFGGKK